MNELLQALTVGLSVGAVYGLVALGFVLIYKSSRVLNIAQGELVLVSAFICYFFSVQLGLPFYLAVVLTIGLSFLLGRLIERLLLRPMIGQPLLAVIMMTIGLGFVLSSIVMAIWGADFFIYPQYLPTQVIKVGVIVISQEYLWSLTIALLMLAVFALFFRYTGLGLEMRAVADDEQAALSMGIDVRRIYGMAWGISCVASALAGIALGTIMAVFYYLSFVGLKAIPAVIVGGLESIPGAIIGGLIIGLLENVAGLYVDPILAGIKEVFPYFILIIVLLVRPHGLFGEKRIERI